MDQHAKYIACIAEIKDNPVRRATLQFIGEVFKVQSQPRAVLKDGKITEIEYILPPEAQKAVDEAFKVIGEIENDIMKKWKVNSLQTQKPEL